MNPPTTADIRSTIEWEKIERKIREICLFSRNKAHNAHSEENIVCWMWVAS